MASRLCPLGSGLMGHGIHAHYTYRRKVTVNTSPVFFLGMGACGLGLCVVPSWGIWQ